MNPLRRLATVAGITGLAGMLLALVGCLPPLGEPRLRLAIVDWPAYEYFYLAQKRQLDHQEGFRLQVDQFASLNDQRLAFSHGEVEAIATTLPDAIQICRDTPARCPLIVLVLDQSNGADQLIARAGIRAAADLKGQRVGLERSVLADFILLRALDGSGLTFKDLQLHYAAPKGLLEQLRNNTLAAIVTYAPHSDELVSDPRWRVLFSSRQTPGEVVDVLAVSPSLADRHPRLVRALVKTWWAARRLAQEQPEASVALMAQRQGVSPQQFLRSQALISYPDQAEQASLLAKDGPVQRTLQRLEQQLRQVDRLPQRLSLPQLRPDLL